MPDQLPPALAGPPADYFMPQPVETPPDAAGFAMPPPPPGVYQPTPDYQPVPGYQPMPGYVPAAAAGFGAASLISQFSGAAGAACLVGLITIIVPFVAGRVFFFLPIVGVISGIRAITQGRVIGGVVGIVLNVIGGLITIFAIAP